MVIEVQAAAGATAARSSGSKWAFSKSGRSDSSGRFELCLSVARRLVHFPVAARPYAFAEWTAAVRRDVTAGSVLTAVFIS